MFDGIVADVITELGRLPGIGPKSAQRITFHLLKVDKSESQRHVDAVTRAMANVRFCATCHNLAEAELCAICADPGRDQTVLCVVEEPRDVVAVERTR